MKPLHWYQSLRFKTMTVLVIIALWLICGIFLIMEFRGKSFVKIESLKHIEQAGNTAVAEIATFIGKIETLTAGLALLVERLPKSVETFTHTLPPLLDFYDDSMIAGGGFWPEPFTFDPQTERRSFFWGRNAMNSLQYFDDYNQSDNGYHREEWYVPARYTPRGKCFWSRSYVDPHSLQPMVTCTVKTQTANNTFTGAVTMDVKLEGLQKMIEKLQVLTGGYAFIVDRNNKFITFPFSEAIRSKKTNSQEFIHAHEFTQLEFIYAHEFAQREFIYAHEFAQREAVFTPIATYLAEFNKELLNVTENFEEIQKLAKTLVANSYQITPDDAALIATMLMTNEHQHHDYTYLHDLHELDDDYVLHTPVTAFYFHLPDTFWKLVVVKPTADIEKAAHIMTYWLILYLSLTTLLTLILAYIFLQRWLIAPLLEIAQAVQIAEDLVIGKNFTQLHNHAVMYKKHNEIGILARVFNRLAQQIALAHGELENINNALEDKVCKRTAQLAKANDEIQQLNLKLQAENLRMGTELEIVRQLQQMVLPKPEEFNTMAELDIVGFMQPADEVGGDYYDVLYHEGRIKIGIGDVTGHGLESGVLMLMVQTAVRTLLANDVTDPQLFLCILNRVIYQNIKRMGSDKNLTLSLLDYREGGCLTLTGQHEEVLIVRKGGTVERVDTIDLGFMVGLEANIEHLVRYLEVKLEHGDGVVLYTDGITEAINANRQQYGIERLCQVIENNWQYRALDIQKAVISSVRQHIGSSKTLDDITLVVVKHK